MFALYYDHQREAKPLPPPPSSPSATPPISASTSSSISTSTTSASISSMSLAYCRKSTCQCPSYETPSPSSTTDTTSTSTNNDLDKTCALCSHTVLWHHLPLSISKDRNRILQQCDTTDCQCPIWVGTDGQMGSDLGNSCALCQHSKNRHERRTDLGTLSVTGAASSYEQVLQPNPRSVNILTPPVTPPISTTTTSLTSASAQQHAHHSNPSNNSFISPYPTPPLPSLLPTSSSSPNLSALQHSSSSLISSSSSSLSKLNQQRDSSSSTPPLPAPTVATTTSSTTTAAPIEMWRVQTPKPNLHIEVPPATTSTTHTNTIPPNIAYGSQMQMYAHAPPMQTQNTQTGAYRTHRSSNSTAVYPQSHSQAFPSFPRVSSSSSIHTISTSSSQAHAHAVAHHGLTNHNQNKPVYPTAPSKGQGQTQGHGYGPVYPHTHTNPTQTNTNGNAHSNRPTLHAQILPSTSTSSKTTFTDGMPTPSTFRRLRRSSEPISPNSLFSARTTQSSSALSHTTAATSVSGHGHNHGAKYQVGGATTGTDAVTNSVTTVTTSGPKKWESHCSRNIELEVSPQIATVSLGPGGEIECIVKLGDKVSLSNYDRLEVCLMGISTVSGEPPEHHTFLTLTKSILPRSSDVKSEGRADREWSFIITIPENIDCSCRGQRLSVPPTYTHDDVQIRYMLELTGKRKERFSTNDRLQIPLTVSKTKNATDLPLPDKVKAYVSNDGPWTTALASKMPSVTASASQYVILVEKQKAPIVDAELSALVTKPRTNTSQLHILYRLSLHFAATSDIDTAAFDPVLASLRISLSRRIVIRKISPKNRERDKELMLPARRILSTIRQTGKEVYRSDNRTILVVEGRIETNKSEVIIWTSCNADVKFDLSAHISSPLLSSDISVVLPVQDFTPKDVQTHPSEANGGGARSIRSVKAKGKVRDDILLTTVVPFGVDLAPSTASNSSILSPAMSVAPSIANSSIGGMEFDNMSVMSYSTMGTAYTPVSAHPSRSTRLHSGYPHNSFPMNNSHPNYYPSHSQIPVPPIPSAYQNQSQTIAPTLLSGPMANQHSVHQLQQPQQHSRTMPNSVSSQSHMGQASSQSHVFQSQGQTQGQDPTSHWHGDIGRMVTEEPGEFLPPPIYQNAVHDAPVHLRQ